jgi:hypothetical protein
LILLIIGGSEDKMTLKNVGSVWILGRQVDGLRSIGWFDNPLPSLADCDTLIVDTTTLNEKLMKSLDLNQVTKIFDEVSKRFRSGGNIICIMAKTFETTISDSYLSTNYFWSPIFFNIVQIPKGKKIKPAPNFPLIDYFSKLNEWELKLDSDPQAKNNQYTQTGSPDISIFEVVQNQSSDVLGGIFSYDQISIKSGLMFLIPPLDHSDISINTILDILGVSGKTVAPSWVKKITMPNVQDIEKQIQKIYSLIDEANQQILKLESKKEDLEKYRKLLYSTDRELEQIVMDSLNLLKLKNVRPGRNPSVEDLLFDSQTSKYDPFVVEVKGVKKNISLDDIREVENWAFDYEKMNKNPKAVVIANTWRLDDIDSSQKNRLNFDNFEKHCSEHNVCLMPSLVLFALIQKALAGETIDPKKIEQSIADTKGVLRLEQL